jgi:hypothetical protein
MAVEPFAVLDTLRLARPFRGCSEIYLSGTSIHWRNTNVFFRSHLSQEDVQVRLAWGQGSAFRRHKPPRTKTQALIPD